ncbi:MAG TPA: LacI family DNA-binding transcriptional regulator [Actinocrinis sp.]|nr:LacI family DNA-binding transcriptional regulator [Actinocrinis sp.]
MAGIRELARECGVSVATVSRALNGHPEVSETTRRQVQEAARRLGYRPSQSARALVRGRSDTVGLLWDTGYEATGRRHPFLLALLVGVKRALSASGRHVLLLNVDDHRSGDRAYLDIALQHQLDGVVMMGVDDHHPAMRTLYGSGFPCVALDLPIAGPRATYVTSDNYAGAAEAVRYLHSLGHREIATITGPTDLLPAAQRLAGYEDAIRDLGLKTQPEYVETGDFFLDSGYSCAQRLAALPTRPTAVFVAGDEMAVGAMHAFEDEGINIPADMAVVGFDDIEAASLVRPALTTIAQDPIALGTAAVAALLALVDTPLANAEQLADVSMPRTVPTRLVVRQSCAAKR